MVIDWFTIGAQILNFLVLVWLLKRYLYGPILAVIARREKRIAATLSDATASKAKADDELDALLAKNQAFDAERAALISKAGDDARSESKRLADVARAAADAFKEKQQNALARDANNLATEISRRVAAEVFAIARKLLADMADTALEDRMSERFVKKLGALDEPAKVDFARMLQSSAEPAVVRTAFDLPSQQIASIRKAIDAAFAVTINPTFETVPDLVSGIELVAGGQTLAWSLSDGLKSLEKSVGELLKPDGAEGPHAASGIT